MFVVVAATPPTATVAQQTGPWSGFVNALRESGGSIGTDQRPSLSTWLLSLPSATPVLASVLAAAQEFDVPCRVLYFENDAQTYVSGVR
jgi:hypothetical protein